MKILYVTRHFNHSGYLVLEELLKHDFEIAAVLLHHNKDRWRNRLLRPFLKTTYYFKCWYYRCEALKTIKSEEELAKRHGLPIIWADSIKSDSFYEDLKILNPEIIVLGGGWHELIPKRVFSFPRLGCINTHPSALPEFRGTSITRWQVLHGVNYSGSTIHYVDDTFDTGGVLAQNIVKVKENTPPQTLFYQLGLAGAQIMSVLLKRFQENGKQLTYEVDHNKAHYKYFSRWKWEKEKLVIDWGKKFREIHFFVLSNTQESYEYLGPIFYLNGNAFFLRKTKLLPLTPDAKNYLETIDDDEIRVHKMDSEFGITLVRRGDSDMLALKTVQRYDSWHKYRRAWPAQLLLKPQKGAIVNFHQINHETK